MTGRAVCCPVQNDVIPLEEGGAAEGAGDPSSSAAAAAGMPADLGAVPQLPPGGVYYNPAVGYAPAAGMLPPAAAAGAMGVVPEIQQAAAVSPAVPMAEPPVAAVMFEQWANEGQQQAAAAMAAQQAGQQQ